LKKEKRTPEKKPRIGEYTPLPTAHIFTTLRASWNSPNSQQSPRWVMRYSDTLSPFRHLKSTSDMFSSRESSNKSISDGIDEIDILANIRSTETSPLTKNFITGVKALEITWRFEIERDPEENWEVRKGVKVEKKYSREKMLGATTIRSKSDVLSSLPSKTDPNGFRIKLVSPPVLCFDQIMIAFWIVSKILSLLSKFSHDKWTSFSRY